MTNKEALIQRMAEDIDPKAFELIKKYPDVKSPPHQFWLILCNRARETATRLIEAGWRPTSGAPE